MMNRRLVCANPVFPAEKASFAQKYQAKRTHRLQQYVTYARQLIPIIAKNKRKKALYFFLRNGTLLATLQSRKPDYGTRKLTAAEPDRMRH